MIQEYTFWLVLFGAVVVFWRLPERFRFGFLAGVSYLYLASLEPVGVTLLIGWTLLFFYVAPRSIADKTPNALVLPGLVIAALGYLIWSKYVPVFVEMYSSAASRSPGSAIIIPLGISYFSFKLIHYAVETARGNIADRSLSRFFCYIFLFPIFTAGPIERYDHFVENTQTSIDGQSVAEGLTRIAHGLIKVFLITKLVEVDRYGAFGVPDSAATLVLGLADFAPHEIWLFLALTYLYAYLDFSAYTDIAIGASRLFGFRILENFRWPILAVNIQDFWTRWHMTLAGWCRYYIYMPVIARTRSPYAAVFATFTAMGVWHGAAAGWLFWGLYHATGVAAYMYWARFARRFQWWRAATKGRLRWIGLPITFAFVSGSYAFSSTGGGALESIAVFLSLFGIRIGV